MCNQKQNPELTGFQQIAVPVVPFIAVAELNPLGIIEQAFAVIGLQAPTLAVALRPVVRSQLLAFQALQLQQMTAVKSAPVKNSLKADFDEQGQVAPSLLSSDDLAILQSALVAQQSAQKVIEYLALFDSSFNSLAVVGREYSKQLQKVFNLNLNRG